MWRTLGLMLQLRCGAMVTAALAAVTFPVHATAMPRAAAGGRCLQVPPAFVESLKIGVNYSDNLSTHVAAVQSRGKFGGLNAVRDGPVFFVSARIRGYGMATWAAAATAFRTGVGVIIPVGANARRASTFGFEIPTSTLKAWGLTPHAEGFDLSRACAR
jgi:hypothetical protein